MRTALLAVGTLAAAAAIMPATASAAAVRGVVVARSHGTLLVATPSGRVVALEARAPIGARLVGRQVVGHASRARIHGVVVATKGSTIFVASNRQLVAIASAATTTPGTIVNSTVTVYGNGRLDEESESNEGQDTASTIQVQATVAAVAQGTITLTVNGQYVTVDLPGGLTLPQSLVGQVVTIDVSLSQDDQGDDDSGDGDGSGDGGGSGGDGGGN